MSSRLLSLLAAVALSPVVVASPASAEPSPTALTASIHENHFDGWDIALGALAGVAGFSVGAFGGGAIGAASAGGCARDRSDHSLMGNCFLHGLGETLLGGVIGGTFGAAGGIYAHGEFSGHDGGFGATPHLNRGLPCRPASSPFSPS